MEWIPYVFSCLALVSALGGVLLIRRISHLPTHLTATRYRMDVEDRINALHEDVSKLRRAFAELSEEFTEMVERSAKDRGQAQAAAARAEKAAGKKRGAAGSPQSDEEEMEGLTPRERLRKERLGRVNLGAI